MSLPIVFYGNPILRAKGLEIPKITAEIKHLAEAMIETMHAARGVGLAAQQIGRALQLTVIDLREVDRPSQLLLGTREVPAESMMPMVLLNPRITQSQGEEDGNEGCLSFPGINADIRRSATVQVSALGLREEPLRITATGLLARVLQHEIDHLNGVLFIDRMPRETLKSLETELRKLEKSTLSGLKKRPRDR